MNKKTNILGALCFGASLIGYAQQDANLVKVEQLEEVVVSDSRFSLKRENSGKTVIKISKKEIQDNQGRSVADLINAKSGIEINGTRSAAGQNLGVFVRGGRNRQVLVLIDGVQVNDVSQLSGEYDFRLLNLSQIESIEIIKGAASTLYGNAAAAAVINVTTLKADKEGIKAVFTSVVGTNQPENDQDYDIADFNNSVALSGTLDKFTYRMAFNQQFADGLSAAITPENEKDPFSKYGLDVNLGYAINDNFSVNLFGNITDIESGFDGGSFADAPNFFNSKQSRLGLSSKFNYTKGSVNLNVAFSEYQREFISSFPSTPFSKNVVVDLYNKYTFNESLYTILGVNASDNDAQFLQNESFTNVDPYANVVYVTDFGLNLNVGARLNIHSAYGENLTYNFNPSYVLKGTDSSYTKFFASYSTSFIAPSLSQLFGQFGPNPNLNPEENITLELGTEFKLSNDFRVNALYFNRQEKDFIFFDFATGYQNTTDDVNVHGVELEANANLFKNLNIAANYTFVENKDNTAFRIPKHKANLQLGYNISEKSFASLSYQYTYDRLVRDFRAFPAPTVVLDPFSIVNLYASHYALDNTLKVFGGIDNVLNEDYQDVFGFTSRGRNVRLGVQITF